MQWEELSGDRFAGAVEQSQGVCLVPLSVIERHGHHLPLGTDMYIGRELCRRVALLEPAVVFPDCIFTQIPEARHHAGTISIDGDLIVRLLDNICREVARNGLKKIVLVNAHGGNYSLVRFFNELQLYSPRDYVVYMIETYTIAQGAIDLPWDPSSDSHAGAGETSIVLAIRPDLVEMQRVPREDEGKPLNRLQVLRNAGVQTGIWWYADYPTHYAGDAGLATAEMGNRLLEAMANAAAKAIHLIKEDSMTRRLQDEFYAGSNRPNAPEPP